MYKYILILGTVLWACNPEQNPPLTHLVFLDLKEGVDTGSVIEEIKKMQEISSLDKLEIGTFKDLDDTRAMNQFEIVIYTQFCDSVQYTQYQEDPIHLNLREYLKDRLAGPPVTYDYN